MREEMCAVAVGYRIGCCRCWQSRGAVRLLLCMHATAVLHCVLAHGDMLQLLIWAARFALAAAWARFQMCFMLLLAACYQHGAA